MNMGNEEITISRKEFRRRVARAIESAATDSEENVNSHKNLRKSIDNVLDEVYI